MKASWTAVDGPLVTLPCLSRKWVTSGHSLCVIMGTIHYMNSESVSLTTDKMAFDEQVLSHCCPATYCWDIVDKSLSHISIGSGPASLGQENNTTIISRWGTYGAWHTTNKRVLRDNVTRQLPTCARCNGCGTNWHMLGGRAHCEAAQSPTALKGTTWFDWESPMIIDYLSVGAACYVAL